MTFKKRHIVTEETKRKIGKSNSGKHPSEEAKKKMSLAHLGKHISEETRQKHKNYHPTIETKEKIKEKMINRKHTWGDKISKSLCGNKNAINNKNRLGKKTPKETKLKQRETAIQRIEKCKLNGLPLTPCIGKYETEILNKFETFIYPYKILRQYKITGFFLDGYCPALNLAIEIDESHHFNNEGNLYKHDLERQKIIEEELKCNFFRIRI